ncbi:hypothetical protein GALMADRAFT_143724 [Galerina marginata CBS 339.88]|uniref:Uncharacterized protein n=1 Tax=Galerina marginata (strain CBS 339.88) TaxID=685588 RepID=A0A067SKQ9_GALM3|nr:hypothetical protein GALMADRAFT_143724 [Galerina marginata CBS 339.88]
MSSIIQDGRIHSSQASGAPTWTAGDLVPDARSGGAASTATSRRKSANEYRKLDIQEPCFVSNSSCYTHEGVYWLNTVGSDPAIKKQVEDILIKDLRIVYENFSVDSNVNQSNLDLTLHAALEKYAFFAVTGSLLTLKTFIDMFEKENERRQVAFDSSGLDRGRMLDLELPAFLRPQYELVALRPEHMLPDGKVFVAYNRDASSNRVVSHKLYVPGEDHTLRERPGSLTCPRFPPFHFDYSRAKGPLNPLLVILNAEIKFRRYLRQTQPPPLPLPDDVMKLINLTIELVNLIYWKPIVRPNTPAVEILLKYGPLPGQESSSQSSDPEKGHSKAKTKAKVPTQKPQEDRGIRGPGPNATLEERRDYGQYLMSGRDLPFDEDDQRLLEELAQADLEEARQRTQNDLVHNAK